MKHLLLLVVILGLLTTFTAASPDTSYAQGVGSTCDRSIHCETGLECRNGTCSNPASTSSSSGLVPCGNEGQDPCQFSDLFRLLDNILRFLIFQLAPILVTAMVVVGGFFMLTAAGNPGRFNKGTSFIKSAIIGYAIILVAVLIIDTVLAQIGVVDQEILDWRTIDFNN